MKWIDLAKEGSPKEDCMCIVINNKWSNEYLIAYYIHNDDVFTISNTPIRENTFLNITHYIMIPEIPRFEE